MQNDLSSNQDEQLFESLIQGLLLQQYGLADAFVDPKTLAGLYANLLQFHAAGQMRPAGVGQQLDYNKNAGLRGDVIKWIEPDTLDLHERRLSDLIEHFIRYLNQTCYTGINSYEMHYAYYAQHSFYKRHLDQFKNKKGRKFSLVLYLNKDWLESDGGNLSLYLDAGKQVEVYPIGGSTVFFKSAEVEHEVHPSGTRFRISIAVWFKQV